ncbi:ABC-type nitrate/sulfonate/bicarbonate transport system ATPase component [Gaiella occulta]|uniref:ABC-type nitrate/sulfonate/bicarbonate transport system ATPase component n=1 Tax=Gaiella occulta TaxID=1002870 RepID=A0A7M2Z173_9ACTN|nr:ABC transporter ATP-binding protein [Gaiella occulta]RDI75523.1 ABC-type nitrate/sulfonate/bicarbonate transport system ATPase component [Gaiella occulta]
MTSTRFSPAPAAAGALAIDAEVIVFRDAGKVFPDGTEAVRDVSFTLRRGDFLSVVGPSGCGKSTLLRMASGLGPHTSGEVVCRTTNVGYVFQDATLLPWRTVQKNVELLAELEGAPGKERRRLAHAAISLVGLEGFENHYPKALSGGMRMRTSVARALTMKPPLFLLDEPFGALDEITRGTLNEELMRLFISEQFGAIFITHSISEAIYLSTRVLVMSARPGRIVADFDVPFPYPRSPDLRFDPVFASLAGEVSHALRLGHE